MNGGENRVIFATLTSKESQAEARLMLDSLRSFGGDLAQTPCWVFCSDPDAVGSLEDAHTRLMALPTSGRQASYFERKVAACARAEALAPPGTEAIAWIDQEVLVVQPPRLLALGKAADAAFRPVHIRNVGSSPDAPLDAFWKGITKAVGVADIHGTVTSFVDGQVLRSYYNSHAFALRPGLGLMQRWYDLFIQLMEDQTFQENACADEIHQIFLFQALLSTLVAAEIDPGRFRLLPPEYNYPYHLQEKIPAERRLARLNEAVTITHEARSLHPGKMEGIVVGEPLRSWLIARIQ